MVDKFKDECGVFGISGHPEASNLVRDIMKMIDQRFSGNESTDLVYSRVDLNST